MDGASEEDQYGSPGAYVKDPPPWALAVESIIELFIYISFNSSFEGRNQSLYPPIVRLSQLASPNWEHGLLLNAENIIRQKKSALISKRLLSIYWEFIAS